MKYKSVRLVLGIAILSVVLISSCDLFGSDDDGVSREDRRDEFISHLLNQRYDRLTRTMDPNIPGMNLFDENAWKATLQVAGNPVWSFGSKTTDTVIINSVTGIGRAPGVFYFTYVKRGDDFFFSRIEWSEEAGGSKTRIAPLQ